MLCLNHTAPTAIYTLSLHDALPICPRHGARDRRRSRNDRRVRQDAEARWLRGQDGQQRGGRSPGERDRKSTRLNSSHLGISYAVFCLKKKTTSQIAQKDSGTTSTSA